MRIRVRVDVHQSLKKDRKVRIAGGEWSLVKFKYEKLETFCFVCGRIGHFEQSCEALFAMEEDIGIREWGVELRADLRWGGGGSASRYLREERHGGRNPSATRGGSHNSKFATNLGDNYGRGKPPNKAPINADAANLHGGSFSGNMIGTENLAVVISRANHTRVGTHTCYTNPLAVSMPLLEDSVDNQSEKKRRREQQDPNASHIIVLGHPDDIHNQQHFLTASPGHQACREQ